MQLYLILLDFPFLVVFLPHFEWPSFLLIFSGTRMSVFWMQGLSWEVRADPDVDREGPLPGHSQLLVVMPSIWAMRTSTGPRPRPASRALELGAGTGPRVTLA